MVCSKSVRIYKVVPSNDLSPHTQRLGTFGSAGQLIAGARARVVKLDGTLAGEGEPGELVVNSPSIALGYLNNPQA